MRTWYASGRYRGQDTGQKCNGAGEYGSGVLDIGFGKGSYRNLSVQGGEEIDTCLKLDRNLCGEL
jgi:hypothetical protein